MEQEIITPITLSIERELWERFKDKVPRRKTLNEGLVELIQMGVQNPDVTVFMPMDSEEEDEKVNTFSKVWGLSRNETIKRMIREFEVHNEVDY